MIYTQSMGPGSTKYLDTSGESLWLNFKNRYGHNLRVGVNPAGAYLVR